MTPKLQKVLDSIRRGETELVWSDTIDEGLTISRITAEVNFSGIVYKFYFWHNYVNVNLWESFRRPYRGHPLFSQNKKVKSENEGKQFCQEWYNNYLIQEASKEMVA